MAPAAETTESLLAVALDLFGVQGYHATSMEQVRREVGVSNGSLYHVFPTKASLAARLYADGMVQCQDGICTTFREATSAEEGIRGAVECQARWADGHLELARMVYADWPDEVVLAAAPQLDQPNRTYVRVVGRWLRTHADAGSVVDLPFTVAHALWLGPTQELCRQWVRGRSRLRPAGVAADLADGTWRAVSPQ